MRAVRKVPSDFWVQKGQEGGQSSCLWVLLLVSKMLFLEMTLDDRLYGWAADA